MAQTPPLLITTAIDPPAGIRHLQMTERARRLAASKAAIFFWALQKAGNIVVADSTGCRVLSGEDEDQIRAVGCNIEQVSYAQDVAEVLANGKGYAEGKLIAFALENSAHLAASDSFYAEYISGCRVHRDDQTAKYGIV